MVVRSGARFKQRATGLRDLVRWAQGGWESPAAAPVKRRVIERAHIPGATWIETGTYRGDTTEFLAGLSGSVVSIEPDETLFRRASERFRGDPRIQLVNEPSESVIDSILQRTGGSVCLWLDGHFSGLGTYHGTEDTPIRQELHAIEAVVQTKARLAVLVDDFRDFPARVEDERVKTSSYPTRDALVSWAQRNNLVWTVEHDIFVARKPS